MYLSTPTLLRNTPFNPTRYWAHQTFRLHNTESSLLISICNNAVCTSRYLDGTYIQHEKQMPMDNKRICTIIVRLMPSGRLIVPLLICDTISYRFMFRYISDHNETSNDFLVIVESLLFGLIKNVHWKIGRKN